MRVNVADERSQELESRAAQVSLRNSQFSLLSIAVYVCLGVSCAQFGIVGQPAKYYMMEGLHLSAAEVSAAFSLLMVPWIIKPFYGVVSDLVPLFGYRRKSYLLVASLIGMLGFLAISIDSSNLLISLTMTAFAMSVLTALMVALAVEISREKDNARALFSKQELAFYSSSILVSTLGGYLCNLLQPESALKLSAFIAVLPLLTVSALIFCLLSEPRETSPVTSVNGMAVSLKKIVAVMLSKPFRIVALLTACWTFAPSLGVPLYYFQSKTLSFSQAFIGQLSGWNAAGMIVGGLVSNLVICKLNRRSQTFLTATLLSASIIGYLIVSEPLTAITVEFFRGMASLISVVCIYGMASDVCPKGAEAAVMSTIVAILNLTTNASNFFGGYLFTHTFNSCLWPLVLISALAPLASILFVNKSRS